MGQKTKRIAFLELENEELERALSESELKRVELEKEIEKIKLQSGSAAGSCEDSVYISSKM